MRATVTLEPGADRIDVDATIEVLSADQRYLLFDFYDQAKVEVADLRIEEKGKSLRFTRQGPLLIVELAQGARSAELDFRYTATSLAAGLSESEFVLYEDWLPYLGGQATWDLRVDVPEDVSLGTPSETVAPAGEGRKVYTLSADALDRYPIVGSARPYATTNFEHQGTRFEIWLRPSHAHRLAAVAAAVRSSMDAFATLGAFPSDHYRILEASYAEGHGALGLRNLMVLGEELLDDKHLLPTVAHELSHAWFAGLLRDPQGRWSEGLASYLSQWPLAEDRARLMRWGWTVGYEQVPAYRDFALQGDTPAPRADGDLASAILYGKSALVLQELEQRVGIAKMRQILSLFVYQYRGRSVRWGELQQAVADVMGSAEARRFGRWLEARSAPRWQLTDLHTGSRVLRGTLRQRSDFEFTGSVMVGTMSEQSEILSVTAVEVNGESSAFTIGLPGAARWLVVDPNYTMPRAGGESDKPEWMVRIRGE